MGKVLQDAKNREQKAIKKKNVLAAYQIGVSNDYMVPIFHEYKNNSEAKDKL